MERMSKRKEVLRYGPGQLNEIVSEGFILMKNPLCGLASNIHLFLCLLNKRHKPSISSGTKQITDRNKYNSNETDDDNLLEGFR